MNLNSHILETTKPLGYLFLTASSNLLLKCVLH